MENTLDYNHVKLDPVQLQFKNLKQRLYFLEYKYIVCSCTHYGIGGSSSISIFKSFLKTDKQIVFTGKVRSNVVTIINYGLPKGSELGPLLFSLMMNDLSSFVNSH